MTSPKWGDIIPVYDGNTEKLEAPTSPYYLLAKTSDYMTRLYLHRPLAFGHGIAPVKTAKVPNRLQSLDNPNGVFFFEGPRLPKELIAQTVHFFRRIFDKYKTEAEVLLTQNIETKEYRLYIPTQRVSHGGVYSIYNPATIAPGHLVIGTIHSHCDFSAYHSSTDEGDARDMDGLHLTIGFLQREMPEVAAMVAMNQTFFHYQDISVVADFSDLNAATAPEWWDRYVIIGQVTDAQRPEWASDDAWDEYMGRGKPKPQTILPQNRIVQLNPTPRQMAMTSEEMDWNEYRLAGMLVSDVRSTDIQKAVTAEDLDEFEKALGNQYISGLYDSGIFTDEDLDEALQDLPESGEKKYWERKFRTKMFLASQWLKQNGYKVEITIKEPNRQQTVWRQ